MRGQHKTKYIIVTGGVISGLGKGIVSASIGMLLKSQNFSVSPIKIDPYINIDAGTMRPTEHGEVWVTNDGGETDMDLGNYERFMDIEIPKDHNLTTGQVYLSVIEKERSLKYNGKNVEVIPHIPEEVINRIEQIEKREKPDFVIIEIGGTVGDYQSVLFLEAARQLKLKGRDVCFVHVVYLPIPNNLGEMKTKPAQHSVKELNSIGILPDFLICRGQKPIDNIRREKLSTLCNVPSQNIISAPDLKNIYEVPLWFEKQNLAEMIFKRFGKRFKSTTKLKDWKKFINNTKKSKTEIKIGIVGKYFDSGKFSLEDSYASVIESIKHASWHNKVKANITWIDSKEFEKNPKKTHTLKEYDAIIVPGGFGNSGVQGKINAIKYIRENNIPYLGLCYGMQLAVIEYARNVCRIKDASSLEFNLKSKNHVVTIIEDQKEKLKKGDYGATMRLGSYPAILKPNTLTHSLYRKSTVYERHRHRYEINPKYIKILTDAGLIFSGKSPDEEFMEFIELPNHPYFLGTQAHPEFNSRPLRPSPLFNGLIKAAIKQKILSKKERFINRI